MLQALRGQLRPREGVGLLPAPAPPSKRKVGEMMVKNLNHLNHLGVALAAAAAGVLAAVGMLMLMLLVVVEPAGAAFPGQNGKIAFESYVGNFNTEIFTVNADGTELVRLTNGFEPAWSPDGEKIAFRTGRLGKNEIFTMNVYSEEVDLDGLTNETPGQYEPDWRSSRPPRFARPSCAPIKGAKDLAGNSLDQESTKAGLQNYEWSFPMS